MRKIKERTLLYPPPANRYHKPSTRRRIHLVSPLSVAAGSGAVSKAKPLPSWPEPGYEFAPLLRWESLMRISSNLHSRHV